MDDAAEPLHHRPMPARSRADSTVLVPPARPAPPPGARGAHLRRVNVLIVDDVAVCRLAERELLERRGYAIVGEADCASTAVALVERLTPDAVLLDVHLPDENGFALAARLTREHPGLAVLLTSVAFEGQFYALADACGARGFVPKSQLAQVELDRFWPRHRGR
jgi:two-component system invasion response regulator UvrY